MKSICSRQVELPSALDGSEGTGVAKRSFSKSPWGKGGARARRSTERSTCAHRPAAERAPRPHRCTSGFSWRTHTARLAVAFTRRGPSSVLSAKRPSLAAIIFLSGGVRSAVMAAAVMATSIARRCLYITLCVSNVVSNKSNHTSIHTEHEIFLLFKLCTNYVHILQKIFLLVNLQSFVNNQCFLSLNT